MGRDRFAPSALAGGEVMLVLGEDFAVVAARVEAAFMQPPDLVGEGGDEVEFMRGNKNDGALAAEAFEAQGGAGADEGVAGGQGVVEREDGDGAEIERFGGGQVAAGIGGEDFARVRQNLTSGELQQFALAAAVFADEGNNRAVGGGGGKLVERRQGCFAEVNGHRT